MTSGTQINSDTYGVYMLNGDLSGRTFYAAGRRWIFYVDYWRYMAFVTSADGTTWASSTQVALLSTVNPSAQYSAWYDSATGKVHVAYTASSGGMYWRRGTPNSDGSITWDAAAVSVDTATTCQRIAVIVDTTGRPVVAYTKGSTASPYITKNSLTTTSWTAAFTTQLNATTNSSWRISVVPLLSGKFFVAYGRSSTTLKGRVFDGTSLGSELTISSHNLVGGFTFALSAYEDEVTIAYLESATAPYTLRYFRTTSADSWGVPSSGTINVDTVSNSGMIPAITATADGAYLFGVALDGTAGHVQYWHYDGTSWTFVDWLTETAIPVYDGIASFFNVASGIIGVAYPTSSASPYFLTWAELALASVVELTCNESIGVADATGITKSITVAEGIGAEDLCPLSKSIVEEEQLTVSEVLNVVKAIIAAEDVDASDTVWMVKTMLETEAVKASDAAMIAKAIKLSESMKISDVLVLSKAIKAADSITLADVTAIVRAFVVMETIGTSDAASMIKVLRTNDGATASDAAKLIKTIIVAQAIGAADKAILEKAMRTTEDLELGDGAITMQKALVVAEPVLVADTIALIKQLLAADGITLSETVLRSIIGQLTELYASESIRVTDAATMSKAVRVAQAIAASDMAKLVKASLIAERVGLGDDTRMTKALLRSDAITVQDLARISKLIATADGVTFSDEVRSDKSIVLEDGITAGDLVALAKEILSGETIALEDGTRLTTVIMRTLRIARLHAALRRGTTSGTKASLEVEGRKDEGNISGRKDDAEIEGKKNEEELDG